MLNSASLYALAGVLFLIAFVFDLPDIELHGWLFLLAGVACFGVAVHAALRPAW